MDEYHHEKNKKKSADKAPAKDEAKCSRAGEILKKMNKKKKGVKLCQ